MNPFSMHPTDFCCFHHICVDSQTYDVVSSFLKRGRCLWELYLLPPISAVSRHTAAILLPCPARRHRMQQEHIPKFM